MFIGEFVLIFIMLQNGKVDFIVIFFIRLIVWFFNFLLDLCTNFIMLFVRVLFCGN